MGQSHNITKALVFALLMAIIVIALHIVSLATPWWISSSISQYNSSCVVDNVMGWNQATITCHDCDAISCATNYFASQAYWNGNWRANCKSTLYPTLCEKFPQLFDAVLAMVCIGLIVTTLLFLLFLILMCIPKFVPGFFKLKFFHAALAILGFLCGLVAVIVMATAIPGAYSSQFNGNCPSEGCSFFGSKDYSNGSLYWGPTTGWIVEAVNLLPELLLLILCLAASRKTTKPPV
jgi:hypothetical protein